MWAIHYLRLLDSIERRPLDIGTCTGDCTNTLTMEVESTEGSFEDMEPITLEVMGRSSRSVHRAVLMWLSPLLQNCVMTSFIFKGMA